MTVKLKLAILLIVAAMAPVAIRRPVAVPTDGDWRVFGRDPGAQRFSPLTQITPQNVRTLEPAWTFDTHVHDLQVTPIVVDGDDVRHGRLHRLCARARDGQDRSGPTSQAAPSAGAAWRTGRAIRRPRHVCSRAPAMAA